MNVIVDDGGDATMMIHVGYDAENNAAVLDKEVHAEDEIELNAILKKVLAEDGTRWHRVAKKCVAYLKRLRQAYTVCIRCRKKANCCSRHSM